MELKYKRMELYITNEINIEYKNVIKMQSSVMLKLAYK